MTMSSGEFDLAPPPPERPGLGMARPVALSQGSLVTRSRLRTGRRRARTLAALTGVVALFGGATAAATMAGAGVEQADRNTRRTAAAVASVAAPDTVNAAAVTTPGADPAPAPTPTPAAESPEPARRKGGHTSQGRARQRADQAPKRRSGAPIVRNKPRPGPKPKPKPTKTKAKPEPKKCPIYDNGVLIGYDPC